MPTASVSILDGADGVIKKIVELEAGNARVLHVSLVGDQQVILYENKPRVGRPPKETRG